MHKHNLYVFATFIRLKEFDLFVAPLNLFGFQDIGDGTVISVATFGYLEDGLKDQEFG